MSRLTEQLKKLLTSETAREDFKQSAMALARQGADITVRSSSGAEPTLLHVLARNNENGTNNEDIAELVGLNPDVLKSTDRHNRTALQFLMDALTNRECSFANFKQSAMALARKGANTTLKSTAGAQPALLHVLARQNEDGANNDDIAELVGLNRAVLESTDYYGRTALQSLIDALTSREYSFANFKQSAMALARQRADTTLKSTSGAQPTLLHILARQNENGANNDDIAELVELNANVLTSTDYYGRTALQSLIDALTNRECSFANFKHSAMVLARKGANTTLKSTSGAQPALLHVLARQNEDGANNDDIAELVGLNRAVLESIDYYGRTALQSLIDALTSRECSSFANFKQSAMALARQRADTTLKSTSSAQPTLLHVLARQNENGANNDDIAELVELNANVLTSTDYYGRTALQSLIDALTNRECSFANFKHSAMVLARKGANTTLKSTSGAQPTLLHVLARQNENGANNDDIATLVELNANVLTSTDYYGRTALQSLIDALTNRECSLVNFKQSAMTLARQGADLSLKGTDGSCNTLLHVLVLNDVNKNNGEIDALIALNSDVINFRDGYGCTPVHSLLANNSDVTVDVFGKLLSATNLDLKDSQDATLLHAACLSGNLAAVEYFFNKGLSLTASTNTEKTLIHYAVWSGNVGLIQWLIDTKQIDINAKDKYGDTALHSAATSNNREVVDLLVYNGADLTIKNNEGENASDIATLMGHHALASYLFNPKDEFFQKIQALHDYGILLKDKGASKGQVAIDLASNLMAMANQFFEQELKKRNFSEFKARFSALLHSKDQEMSAYRISWGMIVANIAIALTSIGLLFVAGKLIHSKVTGGRALFFFQKNKTTSEEKIADIEQSAGWSNHGS